MGESVPEDRTDLAAAVEELLAKQAIREALQDYCRAVDRIDRELLLSVWHPDATIRYEGGVKGTPEEIVDFFIEAHRGFAAHAHHITNVTTVVDGNTAVSEAYVTSRLRSHPDEAGRAVDMVVSGRYLDRWSKRHGRWAIEDRQFVFDVHGEHEVVADFGHFPDWPDTATAPLAHRGREDPSYALLESLGA
ncbi:MAG: nuclear transport factor 2 family protein [Actinomycetota bacterium]|nr:nuclear transport factor 2 family protein [Actinomycetota bacterium]